MIASLADARYLARAGRLAAAEARLRLILAAQPDNEEARLWFAALRSDSGPRRAAPLQALAPNPNPNPDVVEAPPVPAPPPSHQAQPYSLWHRRHQAPGRQSSLALAREEPIVTAPAVLADEPADVATESPLFGAFLVTVCFLCSLALGLEAGQRLIRPAAAALQTVLPRALALLLS